MKWRPLRDWFTFYTHSTNIGFGAYIGATMPEGVHISLHFWRRMVVLSCVWGDWE